ncbi:DUF896 domain-containing protein [Acidaminobacterium chupaoyuni]
MIDDTIKRINELAAKARQEELSEEEIAERDLLRRIYIDSVKKNLRDQLEHTVIEDEQGNRKPLKRKN